MKCIIYPQVDREIQQLEAVRVKLEADLRDKVRRGTARA